uniref:Neuronal membrane glycoprotein M6-b n=1 Tax=Steinernema glaseri TaxID=37863 RepID=A0A1I8A3Y3_9BILA
MHHRNKKREVAPDRNLLQVAVPPNKDGCHARTPYVSLMGTLLTIVGVSIFTIMMTWSFNSSIEQTRRTLQIDKVQWIDRVQIILYAISAFMAISAFFLLFVGFLSTGSTREELEELYGTPKSRNGGKLTCALALVLSYVLTILWIGISAFTGILIFIYYIFTSLCNDLSAYSESDCLDFSILRQFTRGISDSTLKLCGADVQQFCAFSSTSFTWFVVAHIGGLVIVLGLLLFLICNAANYAHVTNNKRYLELKEKQMVTTVITTVLVARDRINEMPILLMLLQL